MVNLIFLLAAYSLKSADISSMKTEMSVCDIFSFMYPCSCFRNSISSSTSFLRLSAFLYMFRTLCVAVGDRLYDFNRESVCPNIKVRGVLNSCDILVKKRSFDCVAFSVISFSFFSNSRDCFRYNRVCICL